MSCFSKVFEKSDEFNSLAGSINISGAAVGATGVSDAVKAHMIHSLIQEKGEKAVIIMPDEASAVRMSENTLRFPVCPALHPLLHTIITTQRQGILEMQRLLQTLCR